ncbi:hypothetical protein NUKP18_12310 [Klebsiella variicola]|nr:hypothetical protein NUKP18_12310 [Klebsiella variicola]GKK56039.1 hypothetical protein NUKP40_33130 [Klebsiella variicola]GKM77170.1 hypothetical protein NUKP68_23690 [Klebsiella variicola]
MKPTPEIAVAAAIKNITINVLESLMIPFSLPLRPGNTPLRRFLSVLAKVTEEKHPIIYPDTITMLINVMIMSRLVPV